MAVQRTAVALFIATSLATALVAVGCSSKAAIRQEKARTLAASTAKSTVASPARPSEHFAKPAPRDPVFAQYSDPDSGASFRYPRSFALLDSSDDDVDSDRIISWQQAKNASSGVRTAEELSAVDPGATLITSVVVPADAYPNTSFAGGSLQFATNRYQTGGTCRSNLLARFGDAKGPSGTVTAQGVTFAWIDTDAGDGSTEFYERDYAGFVNDACYEFFIRVGVGSTSADRTIQNATDSSNNADNSISITDEESTSYRRPNERKIFAHLEKIVASLQFERATVSVLDKPKYKALAEFPSSN
jgi:hypothetical protein